MRYTLLDIVQLIMSSTDSDEVNSIDDTVESQQIAKLVKSVYYDLATDLGLPEHETLFQLNASGTSTKPCIMTVPDNVTKVNNVRYDCREDGDTYPDYRLMEFLPFDEFLTRQQSYREWTENVGSMVIVNNGESFTMLFLTNKAPQYYTIVDDQILIFDSYNNVVDTTLQKSKSMCQGMIYPTFTLNDTFTPDLDPTQFSLLINRAKVRAFNEIKQQQNVEAAGEARRQKIIVQKRKRKTPDQPEIYKVVSRFGRK